MKKYFLPKEIYRHLLLFSLVIGCLIGYCYPADNSHNYGITGFAPFQRFTVSGTVQDANGSLEGVTIREKGGSGSAVSGANGTYSINVAGPNATLVFSSTGYEPQEVAVNSRPLINITMRLSFEQLSDVVVTALGITREKKSLGYSVAEVDGKEMTRVAQENILNGISGKVPGVIINQTGGPALLSAWLSEELHR